MEEIKVLKKLVLTNCDEDSIEFEFIEYGDEIRLLITISEGIRSMSYVLWENELKQLHKVMSKILGKRK